MHTPDSAERLTSPPQPIRLLFSSHEEFIEELRQRGPNLEPVVRVSFRKSADGGGVPLTHLTLLATYLRLVDGGTSPAAVVNVVQLAEYLGSLWLDSTDQDSRRCQERAHHLRDTVVRAVGQLGLRVGGGVYLAGEWVPGAGAGSG